MRSLRILIVLLLLIMLQQEGMAQQNTTTSAKKGQFYFYWGYNRSAFTPSDIHFTGNGYDFTLKKVKAADRPTNFKAETYLKPTSMWVPQYNYRIGFFISDKWSLSLGLDHMKYIVAQKQIVHIEGIIDIEKNPFNGTYVHDQILIDTNFLYFEHTDGLNYLALSADRHFRVFENVNQNFELSFFTGASLGAIIPKSNVQMFNGEPSDRFHLAGFGISAQLGVSALFFNHFFVRTKANGGFISMPDILTRPGNLPDRASQHFWFGMLDFALGWQWRF